MRNVLVLAAIRDEFLPDEVQNIQVHYTGIGKINATYTTTKLIHQVRPNLIINIGTSGALKEIHLGKLHKIREVLEHDVKCEPLTTRGEIPFDAAPPRLSVFPEGLVLATGDSFVTKRDKWLNTNNIDLVDMECFAIAKVAFKEKIPFLALKFASDLANREADKNWKNFLKNSTLNLTYEINKILEALDV